LIGNDWYIEKGRKDAEGLLSDDTERMAKHVRLMNSLFLGLSDLCQAFHTNTATLCAPFLYTVAIYGMMLLVEAFNHYKLDVNG
jgi:citrate lyase beta subunit